MTPPRFAPARPAAPHPGAPVAPPCAQAAASRTLARRALAAAALALAGAGLGGCSLGYYAQAVSGEASLMLRSRPVADLLADPATPQALRERLELAARIRAFAARRLGLPDNRSYTRYTDLQRSSVLWNVFATPPLSLTLKTWCYPVVGCAGYRGYFDQAAAQDLARELAGQGLDAHVAPVPAYSTLGWLPDPLLSTFINWPEPELARLIFHELAHQVVYVRDDTRFNESFATAVERAGLERWVAERADAQLARQYAQYRVRHDDLLRLVGQTRAELEALYAEAPAGSADAGGGADAARLARKAEILARLPQRYAAVRDARWEGFHGFDAYFQAPWNNARIAAMAAYNDDVPAFEALLRREDGDLPRFFAAVRELARLDGAARRAAVQALAGATAP